MKSMLKKEEKTQEAQRFIHIEQLTFSLIKTTRWHRCIIINRGVQLSRVGHSYT